MPLMDSEIIVFIYPYLQQSHCIVYSSHPCMFFQEDSLILDMLASWLLPKIHKKTLWDLSFHSGIAEVSILLGPYTK